MPTVPVITRREGLDTDRGGAPRARVDPGAMMIGEAIQGVSSAAMGIATRLHNRQQEKELQDEAVKHREFTQAGEHLLQSKAEGISADGAGFFRDFDKEYAQLVENYRGSLSPKAMERFGSRYDIVTNDVLHRAAKLERDQGIDYAKGQIGTAHESKLIALQRSPELVEQIQKNGLLDIEELGATLPEAEREELKQNWIHNSNYASELAKAQSDLEYGKRYTESTDAHSLIMREEGFRSDAYWDVNAYRTGYGSDTVTRADGAVEKVTQDTVITEADAARDLIRRTQEFEATASGQVGAEAWAGLSPNARAALTSVAYNYGELPSSVVSAVKGGDTAAIAQAVENLDANPERRKREADIIRGGDIPEMSLKQFNDVRTKAIAANTAAKTQRKEAYDLAIVTGDLTNPEVFLQDSLLDDGDKATLYRAFETANKDRALVGAIMAGGRINSFDADQRRAGDKAYSQLIEGATPEQTAAVGQAFVEQTGYIPSALRSELRSGAASDDPQELANAMAAANYYSNAAPKHFNSFEGGESIRKDMERYNASVDINYTPEEAAQKIIDSRDPEKRRSREALLESTEVKDTLDDVSEADLVGIFDKLFDEFFDPLDIFSQVQVGISEEAKLIAVQDYKTLLQDAIVESDGDMDVAKQVASERFQKVYNVSTMTLASRDGQIIQKHVPEVAYPQVNGSHDYVRNQAYQTLVEQEIDGILAGRVGAFSVEDVYLQPFDQTEADIEAGRNARYLLYFEDNGKMQMYNLPFYAIPEQPTYDFTGNRRKRDVNRMQEDYRQRVISGENPGSFIEETKKTQPIQPVPYEETTRGREEEAARRALEERAFREGQKAYDETQGPDWMKAKSQADTIERILQGLD